MSKLAPPAGLVLTSSRSNEPLEPAATVRFGASMTKPPARQGTAWPRVTVSTSATDRASHVPWPPRESDAGLPTQAATPDSESHSARPPCSSLKLAASNMFYALNCLSFAVHARIIARMDEGRNEELSEISTIWGRRRIRQAGPSRFEFWSMPLDPRFVHPRPQMRKATATSRATDGG